MFDSKKRPLEITLLGNEKEHILWIGKPSQLINLSVYLFSAISSGVAVFLYEKHKIVYILLYLIFPVLFSLISFFKTLCTVFILSSERLIMRYGILDKYIYDIELYRIKDVLLKEPFLFRFFNLGTIRLLTSQKSLEIFYIPGIKNPSFIRNQIRNFVEERRIKRGVKEFDTN